MLSKTGDATLPAADGQPSMTTRHPATYQEAVIAAACVVEQWLAEPLSHSLVDLLNHWLDRMPGSARTSFQDGFLMRIEQRLRASSTPHLAQINCSDKQLEPANQLASQQTVEGLDHE